MKILFIYSVDDTPELWKPLSSWSSIQFGISYISSVLKADGNQTELLVLGSNSRWQDNLKLLTTSFDTFSPNLICLTAVESQYPFIKKLANTIKKNWPDKYLIIGGVYATLKPDDVIKDCFDAVCIGEGEYPTLELLRQIQAGASPHGIPNLWIKSIDGKVEKNAPRPFLQELDNLPFPDRAMWLPWIKEQREDELAVLLGRGCPYNCTYCCNHAIKKASPGQYVRFRSPENIVKEISFLHTTYPTQSKIYFEVESIALNKGWLLEFCKQLEAFNGKINHVISYGCNFRISPQSLDPEIFLALKKANFYKINIGLESGSERVRREILKRNYSNEDFFKVTAMAREYGFKIYLFNIIGLPGESYADYLETVSLNRQCQPDMHYTGIFFPYQGTEIYDICIREKFIKGPIENKLERLQPVIDFPHFSKSQIQKAYIWFNYRVYKGHKPLWGLLKQTFLVKVHSSVFLKFFFRKIRHFCKATFYTRIKF